MKHTKTQKQAANRLLRIGQLGYEIDDIGVIFFVWLAKKGYLSYYIDSFLEVYQGCYASFTIRDMEDFIFYIADCDDMALFDDMCAEWNDFMNQMENQDRFYKHLTFAFKNPTALAVGVCQIFHSDYFQ